MKEIDSIEEMHQISFEILKYVKRICDANGLLYYLAFGTLLGAVRHSGFIPWDDDVDIWMPREDIRKLAMILEGDDSCYKMVSTYNTKNYTAPLPKVIDKRTHLQQNYGFIEKVQLGVYIDVFPLEGAGNTLLEADKIYSNVHKYYVCWKRADTQFFPPNQGKFIGGLRWIRNIPYKIAGIEYWLDCIDKIASSHSFYEDAYVGVLTNYQDRSVGNIFPKSMIGENSFLEFNGTLFRVPEDYKGVLETQYGDYMIMPPLEKRVSHHEYKAMWIKGEEDA